MPNAPAPVIREATAADAAEIVRLGELMYLAVGVEADDVWRANALRQVSSRIGRGDLWGWVIDADVEDESGARLAASALVNWVPRLSPPGQNADWRPYVQWVSTDAAYQRRGYARALMIEVIEFCDSRGIDVIELHSSPFGRSLYRELGFLETPAVDFAPGVLGVPMARRRGTAVASHTVPRLAT